MGLFTKSIILLIIAASTPLVYRQFANDQTIKFMSSYYSNYKVIDQFLRQSAGHLDSAKEYINAEQLRGAVDKLNKQINTLIDTTKSKLQQQQQQQDKPTTEAKANNQKSSEKKNEEETIKKVEKFRTCQCPGEDMKGQVVRLWSKQELSNFDGNSEGQEVYLGFLGLVYNVTVNMQHYAAGSEYNAFAGKDATRAFVTGNFTHDLHDNIQDLDASLYSHVENWASFYNSNYPILGRIEGQFFDSQGCATRELFKVYQVFNKLEQDKNNQKELDTELPECNSEWNGDLKKGRVWCSTKSGGVDRAWVGVPRVYSHGESQKCVCLNLEDTSAAAAEHEKFITLYPDCDPKATECTLKQ